MNYVGVGLAHLLRLFNERKLAYKIKRVRFVF